MKMPKKDYLPLYSEREFQRLLKEVENGSNDARKKIINNLSSVIYDTLKNFKDSKYEYDVLFLYGLRGANNAVDYYDKDKNPKFIPWAKSSIFLSVDYQIKNHPYPSITKDHDKIINHMLSSFNVTDPKARNLLSVQIKFYLENMKSQTYRFIILKYYTPDYTPAMVAKEFNLPEEKIEKIISVFSDMLKHKISVINEKLAIKEPLTPAKTENHTFYERIKSFVKDESKMWDIFKSLPANDQTLFKEVFGSNLDAFNEPKFVENQSAIENIINNNFKFKQNQIKPKSFSERVKPYVKDEAEMWEIFATLSDSFKQVLIASFGPNLDEANEDEILKNRAAINNIITNKFKERSIAKNKKAFRERVKPYVKDDDELWGIFNNLSDRYKQILTAAYGPNLDEIHEKEISNNSQVINNIIYKNFKEKIACKNKKTFYERVKPYVKDEAEMWEIFADLPDNYKQVLIAAFGLNLDEVHNDEITRNSKIISNIIYFNFKSKPKSKPKPKKIKTFYERVKPYVKDETEMMTIFATLYDNYKQVLIAAFGPNLDEIHEEEIRANRQTINNIINYKYKKKNSDKKAKTFYERVKSYVKDETEMMIIFDGLSDNYKQILITSFGPDLDEIHEKEIKANKVIISNIINYKFKKKSLPKKPKSFYERVKSYVKDEAEMWEIFAALSDNYKQVLIASFGSNLDEIHEEEIKVNKYTIRNIISYKYKKKSLPKKPKTFYERVKSYIKDEAEMWEIFAALSDNYKQVLIASFGPNLDEIHEEEIKANIITIRNIIWYKFKKKASDKKPSYKPPKTFYERVKSYVKDETEMWEIFDDLPDYYKTVLTAAFGTNLDEVHEEEIRANHHFISNIIIFKFKEKTPTRKFKTFYERVKPYIKDEAEMWEIFHGLSDNYKQVLIAAFGSNLDEIHEEEISKNISTIYSIISYKFKNKTSDRNPKTFYERVKPYVKDETEMWEIFANLSDHYKQVLIAAYGPNLDEMNEEERKVNNMTIRNIIKYKFNKRRPNKNSSDKKSKPFYERVKPYVKDETEMWEIFADLPNHYKQALIASFGPNLDEIHEEEIKANNITIRNIIRYKFNEKRPNKNLRPNKNSYNKKSKPFYERVKPYVKDENEMLAIFATLSDNYKQILIAAFGPNLDETHREEISKNSRTIENIINNKFKKKVSNKKTKTFYERVKSHVKDETEMLEIFATLSDNYKQILIASFGPNLDEIHEEEIKANIITIHNIISYKFKKKSFSKKSKTFFERVKPYVKDEAEMWKIFDKLSNKYKQILIVAYGSNLDEIHEKEIKNNRNAINSIIGYWFKEKHGTNKIEPSKNPVEPVEPVKQINLPPEFSYQDLENLIKLFYSLTIIGSNQDIEELLIFALRVDETGKYKIADICKLFGKTEAEINEIAKKCLIKYSKIFDVLYTGIINTLKQAPLNNYVKEIMPLKGDNNE